MADTFSGGPAKPARHGTRGKSGDRSRAFGRNAAAQEGPASGRRASAPSARQGGKPFGRQDGRPLDRQSGKPFGKQAEKHARQGQGEREPSFRPVQELFPAFSRDLAQLLDQPLLRALRKAWPLARAHQASLARDIAELSGILTTSRIDLRKPYWAKPSLTSAYLYYFLPWNLVRLCRLFGGMRLPEPAGDRPPILVDLGSGPLTVPLALWLAKPSWRSLPLEIIAVDCAGRPPRLGAAVLEALAEAAGAAPREGRTVQSPLAMASRRLKPLLAGTAPFLITAANVLNELPPERRERFSAVDEGGGMDGEGPAPADSQLAGMASEGSLSSLLSSLLPLLRTRRTQASPRLIFIEPGTRLGGSTLMELRALALDEGLLPLAPCPHGLACPLRRGDADAEWQEGPRMASRLAGRTWCHFTFDTQGAPAWLAKLSVEAGLDKDSLSLACLDLAVPAFAMDAVEDRLDAEEDSLDAEEDSLDAEEDAGESGISDAEPSSAKISANAQPAGTGDTGETGKADRPAPSARQDGAEAPCGDPSLLQARIVSQPFRVPGLRGLARYACTARGLVLIEDASACPSGSLVCLPEGALDSARRDARSGAIIVAKDGRQGRQPASEAGSNAVGLPRPRPAEALRPADAPAGHAAPKRGRGFTAQGQGRGPEDHRGTGAREGHQRHDGQSRRGRGDGRGR